jgi:Tfp pilus assembly protein PilO
MLATRTARWSALTALLCVMLMAAAWLLLIQPRREEAAAVRQKAEETRARNDALELKVTQLRAQFVELPMKEAELSQIYAQMPAEAAMPELVRAIDTAAAGSGVTLQSLTPSVANVAAAPQATAAPSTGAGAGTGTGTSAGTGTTTGGSAAAAAPGLRVVEIPVTIVVQGDYFQTVLFLKKLQTEMTRTFLVTGLQLATGETTASGTEVALTVNGKVFALPDTVASTTTGTGAAASSSAPAGGTAGSAPAAGQSGQTGQSSQSGQTDQANQSGQTAALGSVSRMGASAMRVGENS